MLGPGAACRPAARGGGRPHACGGAPEADPPVAAWSQDRARAQGDWLCPACAAGAPPAPRPRPLTAVEKLLCGRLGLARVEGFWRRGAGPAMVDLRFFLRPEELHTGRLARPGVGWGYGRVRPGAAMVDLRFFLRPEELHNGRLARPARARLLNHQRGLV